MKPLYIMPLLFLFACSGGTKYFSIEEFEPIDLKLMSDSTEVYMLYASAFDNQFPVNVGENAYRGVDDAYVQIVMHNNAGDTFNVLSCIYNDFNQDDLDKPFQYRSLDDIGIRTFFNRSSPRGETVRVDEVELRDIQRVIRDPRYDDFALNDYPTTLGIVLRKN